MFIRRKYKGDISMFGPQANKRQKRNRVKKIIIFIVILVLFALLFSFVFKKKDEKPTQEDAMSEKEVSVLTEELSKFIVVPDEEPLIFTISDVDFLTQEQKFFENANNGDILFVFPEAEKAVVYSPKRERIINAGPVNFNGASMGQIPGTELQ